MTTLTTGLLKNVFWIIRTLKLFAFNTFTKNLPQQQLLLYQVCSNRHTLEVSEPVAALLHDHKVQVKICNGKDTISKKALSDKPKAFRIPMPADSDSVSGYRLSLKFFKKS